MFFNFLYIALFTFSCSSDISELEPLDEDHNQNVSSSYKKEFSFFGKIDYIDTLNNKVIFRTPLDVNEGGDYIEGALLMLDLRSLTVDTIADTMIMYYPESVILNDTTCLVTTQSAIYEYFHIDGKSSYKEFYRVSDPEYILEVSYNIERNVYAILLLNEDLNSFEIRVLDSYKNIVYSSFYDIHYEYWGGYAYGGIHWIDSKLIFSVEDRLYSYCIKESELSLLEIDLFYSFDKPLYSVIGDKLFVANLIAKDRFYITEIDLSSDSVIPLVEISSMKLLEISKSCTLGSNSLMLIERDELYSLDLESNEVKALGNIFYSCSSYRIERKLTDKSIWEEYTIYID